MNDIDRLNLATDLRRLSYWWLDDNQQMINIFWPRVKPLLSRIVVGKKGELAKKILDQRGESWQMAERLMTLAVMETIGELEAQP